MTIGVNEGPPEFTSGIMYSGPGSGSLAASAAAWQALSAEMGSAGAAYGAVVSALVSGAWLGPSSISMALAAAPYVVWMMATAAQCQVAAAGAAGAATAFEAARAGVVPPPVIAANRSLLATLIATNAFGFNGPAIAATEGQYMEMWGQNTSVLYNYTGDLAANSATVVPFMPPPPTTNPAGLAGQVAAVGEGGAQAAARQSVKLAGTTSQAAALPAGMDAQSMMTMGPQFVSMVPQALQGLSSPLSSMTSGGGLGQFQSLLSPFMSMMSNPGMLGGMSPGAASALTSGSLTGFSGAGSGVEALAGRAGSLGGLSVPATWTAGGGAQSDTAVETRAPVAAPRGATAGATAVPVTAAGGTGGMYGGAPMAAGMGGRGGTGSGPRYGTPVKVITRR